MAYQEFCECFEELAQDIGVVEAERLFEADPFAGVFGRIDDFSGDDLEIPMVMLSIDEINRMCAECLRLAEDAGVEIDQYECANCAAARGVIERRTYEDWKVKVGA